MAKYEHPALAGERRGAAFQDGGIPAECHKPHAHATDFAALYIARRYRLPLPMARIVAELANIGGRLA